MFGDFQCLKYSFMNGLKPLNTKLFKNGIDHKKADIGYYLQPLKIAAQDRELLHLLIYVTDKLYYHRVVKMVHWNGIGHWQKRKKMK